MESAIRIGRGASTKAAEYALVALIFIGSLVMWVGLPLGWVWLVTRLADHYPDVYAGALFGCPVTMVLFGLLLARLDALHLRISGAHADRSRTAWLKSLSGERVAHRRPRTVLDNSMVVSVVIAIVAMAVWYFFFAHSYSPGLPAP